jgi:thiamine-phosphate pyrophosphorylase
MAEIKGYYFITDSKLSRRGNIRDVKSAVAAGVKIIQYREKEADAKKMIKEARLLRKICKSATLIINDRIDIALAAGADGVHIGDEDFAYSLARRLLGRDKIIGVTVHSLKEAEVAQGMGADYIGVSPIFRTSTKKNAGVPVGVKLIKEISKRVSIPIVAIGGIALSNAKEVIRAGADSICAISAVITKADVKQEIVKFQSLFQ